MVFKKGDYVIVKSLSWYEKHKGEDGCVGPEPYFTQDMSKYCGKRLRIVGIYDYHREWYSLEGNSFKWAKEFMLNAKRLELE